MTERSPDSSVSPERKSVSDRASNPMIRQALPIYYALVGALLTGVSIYLLWQMRSVLLLLFVSALLAAATSGPADWLQQFRIPRSIAVALIYLVALLITVAVGWFVLPPLFGQLAGFSSDIPGYLERYQSLREPYERLRAEYPELSTFESQVSTAAGRIVSAVGARLTELPSQMLNLFINTLSVFVISILLVSTRTQIFNLIISVVHPEHRPQVQAVGHKIWARIGYYVRAQLVIMAIVGVLTYLSLVLIGVPFALLLSIIVAVTQLIPRVGTWIGRIPLVAIAAFEGWLVLGLTVASSVVIQNLKGSILSPLVQGRELSIHPLFAFVAVLVGSALFGVAGAVVAVPAAAIVQIIVEDVVLPWRYQQLASANRAMDESVSGNGGGDSDSLPSDQETQKSISSW